MTNFDYYRATADKVNAAILRKVKLPWQVEYQPADDAVASGKSGEQKLLMVSPSGLICQRISLPKAEAESFWSDKESVCSIVSEYVVRGASRLAPLRQTSYRNNFPHWLEECIQQLHYLIGSKEKLLQLMTDTHYPFPSKVKVQGNYLPCWVWYKENNQYAVSVIDRRTGLFSKPQTVGDDQLVDNEKWFGAQVIDSADECIETVTYYISELVRKQTDPTEPEPTLTDVIHNPCKSTLSPVLSVGLIMGVVVSFFLIFKMLLGF
ncbi:hypothetical protein [Photobacterium sp. J15]|uniref:hypothetical protein n=1 Tax=Photobacterium sp. J15 TaxID=265901 RepID=UPI0007E3CB64|nr:hypothetical protein [Photobacterium sp. J15]